MNWPSSSRLSFPYFLIPWYHGENMVSGLEHLHAGNSAQVLPLEIVLMQWCSDYYTRSST